MREPDGPPREQGAPYEPGGVLDSRPERRGLNRLVRTGWRRDARSRAPVSASPASQGAPAGEAAPAGQTSPAGEASPAGQAAPAGQTSPAGQAAPALRLRVELVPKTSWYADLRELVDEATWDLISRQASRRAGDRCEICGGRGPRHRPVECHEVWRYDDRMRVQALVRIVALCPDCHTVEHMGFANMHGGGTQARAHLARVNGWTLVQTDAHIADAFRVWARRNQGPWILDMEGLRPYLPAAEYARVARRATVPPTHRS